MNLYEDLKWRGLIQDISDEELLAKKGFYADLYNSQFDVDEAV